jgi:hypothetical protein
MIHDPVHPHMEWHELGCRCRLCEPPSPSHSTDELTAADMSFLALAGAAVGSAIMFLYDPQGSAAALADAVGHLLGKR